MTAAAVANSSDSITNIDTPTPEANHCMYPPATSASLVDHPADVRTLQQLKDFIHTTLCRKENLLEHHFPMSELELSQNGIPCGYQFVLHGPRAVKLAAVWAQPSNEILLYDATGKRFGRIRLPNRLAG